MDKMLLDFITGTANAVRQGDLLITREIAPNGYHHISIKTFAGDTTLYCFWHNPRAAPKEGKPPPKHTGGKKPYIMLMIEEIEKLKQQGVTGTEELIGHLVCLGGNIEWGTGKLVHKRSKKPLQYKDLQELYKCSNKKLNSLLSDMRENNLLFSTKEGYFISTRFIRKGQPKNSGGDRGAL